MMEEELTVPTNIEPGMNGKLPEDEVVDALRGDGNLSSTNLIKNGTVKTLNGDMVGDELEGDALNYQYLLSKINGLLQRLKLDA